MTDRLDDLIRFYDIFGRLKNKAGKMHTLSKCNGRMNWPKRGVYFFMEEGEDRSDTGEGKRIVRVGTHALILGSKTSLWNRLSQHKGVEKTGGGNHRGSIFRLIIGTAIIDQSGKKVSTWGKGSTAKRDIRQAEQPIEQEVSHVIGDMPFAWLAIDDEPSPESLRGYIERNAIGLLSNWKKPPLDPPSSSWLGHNCDRERVRESGLWNQNHVDELYDKAFLDKFAYLTDQMGGGQ